MSRLGSTVVVASSSAKDLVDSAGSGSQRQLVKIHCGDQSRDFDSSLHGLIGENLRCLVLDEARLGSSAPATATVVLNQVLAVGACQRLGRLCIRMTQLSPDLIASIAEVLQSCKSLRYLYLRSQINLKVAESKTIFDALHSNGSIMHLELPSFAGFVVPAPGAPFASAVLASPVAASLMEYLSSRRCQLKFFRVVCNNNDAVLALSEALRAAKNSSIEQLEVTVACKPYGGSMARFAAGIGQCAGLKRLYLSIKVPFMMTLPLDEAGRMQLAGAIAEHSTLQSVHLNGIDCTGVLGLMVSGPAPRNGVARKGALRQLVLDQVLGDDATYIGFSEAVRAGPPSCSSLETISFSDPESTNFVHARLMEGIAGSSTIKSVHLHDSLFRTFGADEEPIDHLFRSEHDEEAAPSPTPRAMCQRNIRIASATPPPEFFVSLGGSLGSGTGSLEELHMDLANLTDSASTQGLCDGLRANTTLRRLFFCNVYTGIATRIAGALAANAAVRLTHLEMPGQWGHDADSAFEAADSLGRLAGLRHLSVQHGLVAEDQGYTLFRSIVERSRMEHLDIRSCEVSDGDLQALLTKCRSLRTIRIGGISTERARIAIVPAMRAITESTGPASCLREIEVWIFYPAWLMQGDAASLKKRERKIRKGILSAKQELQDAIESVPFVTQLQPPDQGGAEAPPCSGLKSPGPDARQAVVARWTSEPATCSRAAALLRMAIHGVCITPKDACFYAAAALGAGRDAGSGAQEASAPAPATSAVGSKASDAAGGDWVDSVSLAALLDNLSECCSPRTSSLDEVSALDWRAEGASMVPEEGCRTGALGWGDPLLSANGDLGPFRQAIPSEVIAETGVMCEAIRVGTHWLGGSTASGDGPATGAGAGAAAGGDTYDHDRVAEALRGLMATHAVLHREQVIRWRHACEARRDAACVFQAAKEGRPMELAKRLRLGALAGGLEMKGEMEDGRAVGPLEAAVLGGHEECKQLLEKAGARA